MRNGPATRPGGTELNSDEDRNAGAGVVRAEDAVYP